MRFSVLLVLTVTVFALLISLDGANAQSDLDQCRFAGQLDKADQGIAACDRVINDTKTSTQDRASALSSRCGWWWTKKDSDRALRDCNEAIGANRTLAAAYLNRGNVYLSKAELDRALEDLNEAIKLDPTYALAYFSRGDTYKSKGDLARAMTDMNEALRLDPNYALAYFVRGRLSYMLGNAPAALEDFTKAIKLDDSEATSYFNRGVAYYVIGGHTADAIADFKKAAELNPKDAYAALWRELAERRTNMPGHLAEAAKQLDMTVWPAPVIREYLGELNAEQTFGAAFDTDPQVKAAQTCEANFYSGALALLKKNRKEAQRQLKLAADSCPPSFVESTAALADLIALK